MFPGSTVSCAKSTSPENHGNLLASRPVFGVDLGTVEEEEPFDLGRLGIVGIERSPRPLVDSLDRLAAPPADHRGCGSANSGARIRPDRRRHAVLDPLTQALEVDRIERGSGRARCTAAAPRRPPS